MRVLTNMRTELAEGDHQESSVVSDSFILSLDKLLFNHANHSYGRQRSNTTLDITVLVTSLTIDFK